MNYFLFAYALPKRRAMFHKLYRLMYRLNAWSVAKAQAIRNYPIRMEFARPFFIVFFGAGPVIILIIALLTLLIP